MLSLDGLIQIHQFFTVSVQTLTCQLFERSISAGTRHPNTGPFENQTYLSVLQMVIKNIFHSQKKSKLADHFKTEQEIGWLKIII
jgi:hypothetical protein